MIWSQSVYLLAKPELSKYQTCYEIRWSDPKTYHQNQGLVASESANLVLLADYVEGRWARADSDPLMQEFLAPDPSVFPPEDPLP